MNELVLTFDSAGRGHCLYSELIDLTLLGPLDVKRASNIEFNPSRQKWEVRNPSGRLLYSHRSRATCLAWERHFFNQ